MKVVARSIDISPINPIPLCGWADRLSPFERRDGKLEANAIWMNQDNEQQLMICIDVLFVTKELKNKIVTWTGLKSNQVLLMASHTHFAPNIDHRKPKLGPITPEYISFVEEKLQTLLTQMLEDNFEDTDVYRGMKKVFENINRRRLVKTFYRFYTLVHSKIMIGPNFRGKFDPRLTVFSFEKNGETKAIMWNYACHPTNYWDRMSLSADYIGAIRADLRQKFGDIPVVFLPGLGGNIRANTTEKGSVMDELFCRPQNFDSLTEEKYNAWTKRLFNGVKNALLEKEEIKKFDQFSSKEVGLSLSEIVDESADLSLDAQIFTWNKKDQFVILSAEPVTEYTSKIGEWIKNDDFIPIGYSNNVFGYLPIDKQLKEGGYEVDGFFTFFESGKQFKSTIENKVETLIKKLIHD